MLRVMMLLVGCCGCASTLADTGASGACRELAVEVDRVLPTRHGGAENRSPTTRLWVDERDVPHVTWSSQWWRVTTMGRSHIELHHAWLAGRRWTVEHEPVPADRRPAPETFAHDGSRWYAQETEGGATRLWIGPPWRAIHAFGSGEIVLAQTLDRDGAWLVTTRDAAPSSPGREAPIHRYRFVAGQLAEVVDLDATTAPALHGAPSTETMSHWPWPAGASRDSSYDSFAVATRDGRSVGVGVGWRPRGPATARRAPHGEPYIDYPNPRRGRGTLVVWVLEGSRAEPRVVPSVRLRRHLRPQVELGPDGAIHVLLVDSYVSDFAPNRYVKLRCRP